MKKLFLLFIASVSLIGNVFAWDNPYGNYNTTDNSYSYQAPQTKHTYDWQSGNSYTTTTNSDGSARMQGMNFNTGSTWSTNYQSNGNMNGIDSKGNVWQYNAASGLYINSDGEIRQHRRR